MKVQQTEGVKLIVVDDLSPEDIAMVQALYSRSAESAEVHLEKVAKSGSGKFMSSYYVGYGHKSIADCGSTTLFIEGVSTLAAKAIQDWPLYSGQETSTRYIDMSKQRIEDPVGTDKSKEVLRRWMAFYTSNMDRVANTVRQRYPRRDGEKEDSYERAVKARAFDILRGFLPAGICTQLSWHTNLRQAGDHLLLLSKHPSEEIRRIGTGLQGLLQDTYRSSGVGLGLASVSGVGTTGGDEAREARASWEQLVADRYTYFTDIMSGSKFDASINRFDLLQYRDVLKTRPRGCVLPHFLNDLGQFSFSFLLDFGSFRDLQRHRNGVCRMPLLSTTHGFEPWYLDQLDDDLAHAAKDLIVELSVQIAGLSDDPVVRQYYTPLGFRVPCHVTYGLSAAVYVMELRSGKTVHPTLRRAVHESFIRPFREMFPVVSLHVDTDPDDWTVRRGDQTITAKG
jgi:thymidylate synthase ThyX